VDDARRRLGGRADCQFVIQFGQLHLTDLFKTVFCFRPQVSNSNPAVKIVRNNNKKTKQKQTNEWKEAKLFFLVQSSI
jgi:hypothetical protein